MKLIYRAMLNRGYGEEPAYADLPAPDWSGFNHDLSNNVTGVPLAEGIKPIPSQKSNAIIDAWFAVLSKDFPEVVGWNIDYARSYAVEDTVSIELEESGAVKMNLVLDKATGQWLPEEEARKHMGLIVDRISQPPAKVKGKPRKPNRHERRQAEREAA